jgi:hypothetical protein
MVVPILRFGLGAAMRCIRGGWKASSRDLQSF